MDCKAQPRKRVSTTMIIRAMGNASLAEQRERIEAEVLAYLFEAAEQGTFTEALSAMQAASFGASCFRNAVHAAIFNAAVQLVRETARLDEQALLNRIPESDRDAASVTLCAIAAFEVASHKTFALYLAELQRIGKELAD